VGYQELETGFRAGVKWVDGRQEAIPSPAVSPSGRVGSALAANRDGSVIVGRDCRAALAEDQSAWVWTARDGTQCLPPPRKLVNEINLVINTKGNAVSEDGRIVVGEQGSGTIDTEAVIWIDRQPQYLKEYLQANGIPGAFALYHRTGSLTDITPDGRVIVGNGAPLGGPRGYIVILPEKP
jgi:uncharacterized membrane protein